METLKVGTKSNPNSVAGALANVFREKNNNIKKNDTSIIADNNLITWIPELYVLSMW